MQTKSQEPRIKSRKNLMAGLLFGGRLTSIYLLILIPGSLFLTLNSLIGIDAGEQIALEQRHKLIYRNRAV